MVAATYLNGLQLAATFGAGFLLGVAYCQVLERKKASASKWEKATKVACKHCGRDEEGGPGGPGDKVLDWPEPAPSPRGGAPDAAGLRRRRLGFASSGAPGAEGGHGVPAPARRSSEPPVGCLDMEGMRRMAGQLADRWTCLRGPLGLQDGDPSQEPPSTANSLSVSSRKMRMSRLLKMKTQMLGRFEEAKTEMLGHIYGPSGGPELATEASKEVYLWRHLTSSKLITVTKDADWLDHVCASMWPRISQYLHDLIIGIVEPAVNNLLPGVLKGKVAFDELLLGEPPKFSEISVLETPEHESLEIRLSVRLSGATATLNAAGVSIGISKLVLEGQLSLAFRPHVWTPPFIGGLEVYFVNPPLLDIEWSGAGRIADIPGLRQSVRSAVAGSIARALVLPNRYARDLNDEDDVDIAQLRLNDPDFVLRMTVVRGEGLTAADVSLFGPRTSDPYVTVRLGAKSWSTPTIPKDLNPVWDDATVLLPVHHVYQTVTFEVYDADEYTADDLIGVAKEVPLERVIGGQDVRLPLSPDYSDDKLEAGFLWVRAQVLDLAEDEEALATKLSRRSPASFSGSPRKGSKAPSGPDVTKRAYSLGSDVGVFIPKVRGRQVSAAYVAAKMLQVSGLDGHVKQHPFKAHVRVGGATESTKNSFPPDGRGVSLDMQKLCLALVDRGRSLEDVARKLDIDAFDVLEVLNTHRGEEDEEVREAFKEAVEARAAATPRFEQIIQLLVPEAPPRGSRSLAEVWLTNAAGQKVGSASVELDSFEGGKTRWLRLQPGSAEILCSLSLRALHERAKAE